MPKAALKKTELAAQLEALFGLMIEGSVMVVGSVMTEKLVAVVSQLVLFAGCVVIFASPLVRVATNEVAVQPPFLLIATKRY